MSKKVIFIIIIILLILGGGGYYMMKRGGEPTPTPTPNIVETQDQITETPTVENVDIATFKVKILNGTAVAGLAAKMKTSLETAGFTVSGTGNADTKDYQTVEVQAKSTVPASALTKLKEEIAKTYTIGADKILADTDENDIVVILGAKSLPTATPSAQTTTPVPTKTASVTTTPSVTSAVTPTPTKSQ